MSNVSACTVCSKTFGLFTSKIQCSKCEGLLCKSCASQEIANLCQPCHERTIYASLKDKAENGRIRLEGKYSFKQYVATVLAKAFREDPVLCFLAPPSADSTSEKHISELSRFFSFMFDVSHFGCNKNAEEKGTDIDLLLDLNAVEDVEEAKYPIRDCVRAAAIWFAVGAKVGFFDYVRLGGAMMFLHWGLAAGIRLAKMDSVAQRHHVHMGDSPHYYLADIGVDPDFQGKGYGKWSMSYGLQRADELGVACYLESSNQRNVPFYESFGFVVLEEFIPQEGCPPIWLMKRDSIKKSQSRVEVEAMGNQVEEEVDDS